jgi:ATP-dependent Clp protease ATP-binding subunit ClpC
MAAAAGAVMRGAPSAGAADAVVVDPDLGLAVVADAVGETRDDLAALACRECRRAAAEATSDRLGAGLAAAERAVGARGGRVALAAVLLDGAWLEVAHAGAARAYLLRATPDPAPPSAAPRWAPDVALGAFTLTALTRDHGTVAAMVEQGLVPRAAGRAHPLRARLTRVIGTGQRPERRRLATSPGDRLLLATNGVWEALEDAALAERLAAASDPTAGCAAILDALGAIRRDHASVAALFVPGPSADAPTPTPTPTHADAPRARDRDRDRDHDRSARPPPPSATPLLDRLGRDLGAAARADQLDPVIGRDAELVRLQLALLSRRKPNAIVVGEAGVGKTCLVEALAQAAAAPGAPPDLAALRIVEIAASALVGGTRLRGELEERVEKLIAEAEAAAPNLVVFFDEIHALFGAPTGGGIDLADVLKPALARGRLRIVGATTPIELERLARDEALLRRFEIVRIDEPTAAAARTMLAGARPRLESHFRVAFLDEAIAAAVELTVRHVPDRRLPDKALDALEHAGARRLLAGDRAPIGRAEIAAALAERLGLPIAALEPDDDRRIAAAQGQLAAALVGQAPAIARIGAALAARARAERGPRATLLFVGPSGVGKTEAARVLAEALYGPGRLTRFDLGEYAEEHQAARLLGAPPGYVGHDRPGALVAALRTRPGSVVLFDELEKAHPSVWNLLLQLLDEGQLTDGSGRVAHLGDAVVILTSNLTSEPGSARAAGFAVAGRGAPPDEASLRAQLRAHLPAELVGRIGAVVGFVAPDVAARRELVARRLARLAAGRGSLATRALAEAAAALEPHVVDLAQSPRELAATADAIGAARLARVTTIDTLRPDARLVLAVLACASCSPEQIVEQAAAAGIALRYAGPRGGGGALAAMTTVADAIEVARALGVACAIELGRVHHDHAGALSGDAIARADLAAERVAAERGVFLADAAYAALSRDRQANAARWPDRELSLWRTT